jgi:hypothetical protein
VYDEAQRSAQRATLALQLGAVLTAITRGNIEPAAGDDTADSWYTALRLLPAAAVEPVAVDVGEDEAFLFELAHATQCVKEQYTVRRDSKE